MKTLITNLTILLILVSCTKTIDVYHHFDNDGWLSGNLVEYNLVNQSWHLGDSIYLRTLYNANLYMDLESTAKDTSINLLNGFYTFLVQLPPAAYKLTIWETKPDDIFKRRTIDRAIIIRPNQETALGDIVMWPKGLVIILGKIFYPDKETPLVSKPLLITYSGGNGGYNYTLSDGGFALFCYESQLPCDFSCAINLGGAQWEKYSILWFSTNQTVLNIKTEGIYYENLYLFEK